MTSLRTSLSLLTAAGIAAAAMTAAGAPAHAAGPGTGRAVVHVNSAKATITKQADGTYLLAMPKGTTGQWMGERPTATGKTKVRVGNLTGEQLTSSWSDLKYGTAGADGSLVWNMKTSTPSSAAVHVSSPKSTGSGVTFVLKSDAALPAHPKNIALSIMRAPGKATRSMDDPTVQKTNIVDDLWIQMTNADGSSAQAIILNSTNNNHCYTGNLNGGTRELSIPSNTCDNIAYSNMQDTGKNLYGFLADFASNSTGNASVFLNITPPGQATYEFTMTWYFS